MDSEGKIPKDSLTGKKALTINERLAKMAEGKAPVVAEKPKGN